VFYNPYFLAQLWLENSLNNRLLAVTNNLADVTIILYQAFANEVS
jgi:hypothetical protein